MQIYVNGETRQIPEGSTIADLLADLEVKQAHVAVERNREIVPRIQHAQTVLGEGDHVEVVTLVGGG